jgi:hydroxymethylpyrimidine pyrophosphatase-like HAD family hydrolase
MKFCLKTQDEQVAKKIAQTVSSCDYLPFSDIPWYKFSSGKATKENAIKFISEKFEIPTEKIVAFGDDFNDIGMLQLCGKGVAMENAIGQVKSVADFITLSNNEDGVAKFLEKFLLKG